MSPARITKVVAIGLTCILAVFAVILYTKPLAIPAQKKAPRITPPQAIQPQSVLTFSPSLLKITGFEEHQLLLMVTTNDNKLTQAQLEIKYDPEKVLIESINPGKFFPGATTPVYDPTRRVGRIDYALMLPTSQPAVSGTGQLAVITFRRNPAATASATTRIELLPKTSLRGDDQTSSLLRATNSATIELEQTVSTPAPQPS